jgi:hypothetical protein
MNKRGHVVNAVLLSVGLGFILEQSISTDAFVTIIKVMPPILLGALFPDIDTTFGTHRKTFHNVWVLGLALVFPFVFDNLHYVWIGIATHYVLDLLGNVKGMGIFHPLPGFYDIPVGVNVNSRWAAVVTLAVTGFELGVLGALVYLGHRAQISGPDLPTLLTDLLVGGF